MQSLMRAQWQHDMTAACPTRIVTNPARRGVQSTSANCGNFACPPRQEDLYICSASVVARGGICALGTVSVSIYGSAGNTAAKPSWTSRTPESGATLELRQTSEMDGFGFESFCLLLVMATGMEHLNPASLNNRLAIGPKGRKENDL